MARTRKVWHITDYAVLYRAMLANRRGQLDQVQYTQRHINPPYDKPEAVRCVNRFRALQQTRSIEQYLKIKFVYEELLDQSQMLAGEYKYLRGYVVDECLQAPTAKRICQMLPLLKTADVNMAIKELARVGLIELVDLPVGPEELPSPEVPEEEQAGENGLFGDEKGGCTSGAPQVHPPFKKENTNKETRRPSASGKEPGRRTRPSASKNRKTDASAAGAASAANPKGDTNAKAPADAGPGSQQGTDNPKPEGQAGQDRQAAQQAAAEAQGQPGTAPRPGKPTGTDGPAGGLDVYSADLFAAEVWRRLRMDLHAPFDSKEGRSQLESFASVWQQACRTLVQPSKLEAVREQAFKQASQLGRKFERSGKKPFNKGHPGPVFNKKLKGLMTKYKPG